MTFEQAKSELMQIYGALSPDKQRAIDTLLHTIERSNVMEQDKDHIWYKGGQYISLRRFLEVKAEAEQEPCEDCVSRKAVLDELKKWDWQELYLPIHFKENIIDVIPSINPQEPKIGRWKRISMDKYVQHAMAYYKCSECGKDIIGEHNYCPNCGAKMESEV